MRFAAKAMHPPHHIYDSYFSGAKDAGKKIWTSKGIVKSEILCENSSKAEWHPLQSRTSALTGCVGDMGLSTGKALFNNSISQFLISSNL